MTTRRDFLKLAGIAGIAAATPRSAWAGEGKNKPNIVLILADDMGIDSVAALNDKCGIPTPNLNALLKQGMHFSDAHSGSAVCSPTRYGVLTGRYSWRSRLKRGIVSQWERPLIEKDRLTLPRMLKNAGCRRKVVVPPIDSMKSTLGERSKVDRQIVVLITILAMMSLIGNLSYGLRTARLSGFQISVFPFPGIIILDPV